MKLRITYEKCPPFTGRNAEHLPWLFSIVGHLELTIDGEVRWACEYELLLAFALCLKRWLRVLEVDPLVELYYESMECEQHPILRFFPLDDTGKWGMDSVWKNELVPVEFGVLLEGVYDYLQALHADLSENCAVDLEKEYRENVDEFLRDPYRMEATLELSSKGPSRISERKS